MKNTKLLYIHIFYLNSNQGWLNVTEHRSLRSLGNDLIIFIHHCFFNIIYAHFDLSTETKWVNKYFSINFDFVTISVVQHTNFVYQFIYYALSTLFAFTFYLLFTLPFYLARAQLFFSLFCLLKINFSLDVFILLLSIERYIYIFISIRQHQINKQCSCENAISNRRKWYGIFLNETNKEFTCVVAAPNGIYI